MELHQDLQKRLHSILGTSGLTAWSSWCEPFSISILLHIYNGLLDYVSADDHFFDAFSSRTCHGHPLPCNPAGECVSQEDADKVFSIGDFEYKYIFLFHFHELNT